MTSESGELVEVCIPEIGVEQVARPPAAPGRRAGPHLLAGNIVSLYVLQGLNYVIPLAVLPYLVRVLGMERYGLMAFAQSFAQYFVLLTDYGFNLSATRGIARTRGDSEGISRIFCSVFLIKMLLLAVGIFILWAILAFVPRFHENSAFFFVAYLAVVGNVLFPTWYFQGIEKMKLITAIVGLARVAGALGLFVFVHRPEDALLALAIQSLALVAGGVTGLGAVLRWFPVRLRWPSASDVREQLRDGWHLFVSTAAVSLYTNTNVFLVGLLAGDVQAGYFSAAEKLVRAAQGLLNPVTQALFPHMNNLMAESRQLALQLAARTLRWTSGIAFVCSSLMWLFADRVVALCFGHAATGSVPIIRWIAFLPLLIGLSNVLGVQTMITVGLDKQFSRILICAGLFNVALATPLIHFFAAEGAAASVFGAELFVTLAMIFVLEHYQIRILHLRKIPT